MGNAIPERQRKLVKEREMGRCFRCGSPAKRGEWHHRRSRSEKDEHRHCTCNGVWLCKTCHDWVHAHPFEARSLGLIVSRHQDQPGTEAAVSHFGALLLSCTGDFSYHYEEE